VDSAVDGSASQIDVVECVDGAVEAVVDDDVRELVARRELGPLQPRGASRSSLGVVGGAQLEAGAERLEDGGAMKTRTAVGIAALTWRAPWTSISSTRVAAARSSLELAAQRPVAVTGVARVLDELVRGERRSNSPSERK
jgi:hypothetical protein